MSAIATTDSKTGRHPLAGKQMSGADMIVQVIADEGTDVIFGYSGGAILPTYDAIFRFNAEHSGQRTGGGLHGRGLLARDRLGALIFRAYRVHLSSLHVMRGLKKMPSRRRA